MSDEQYTQEQIRHANFLARMAAGFSFPDEGDVSIDDEWDGHGLIYRVRDYLPGGSHKPIIPPHMEMTYIYWDGNGNERGRGTMGPGSKHDKLPTGGGISIEIHPGYWLNFSTSEWMFCEYGKKPRDIGNIDDEEEERERYKELKARFGATKPPSAEENPPTL